MYGCEKFISIFDLGREANHIIIGEDDGTNLGF
jgi:hypothetical protein